MRRKIALGEGETERVACAPASAFRGLDTVSGEVLGAATLAERVGWLAALVEAMAAGVTAAHWSRAGLARLASGVAPSGERLPSHAWMALRTLGWAVRVPEGLYVPDRVRRIAEEQAGRALRSAHWRSALVDAVLATWPAGPDPLRRTPEEWDALCAACPDGAAVPASVFRARTRQIQSFAAAHGRLPDGLCELEDPPGGGRQVVLAAADRQLATLARCEDDPAHYAVLTVRLPVRPDPRGRGDWHPVVIRFRLPPTVAVSAALHAPTLRPRGGRLRLDLAHTTAAPTTRRDGHTRAVAFDYGLNTLHPGSTRCRSGWQASGGAEAPVTRPPQPAVARAAGTAHDEHPHAAPATRGQTRRRLPPAHPRHPHPTMGRARAGTAGTSFPPGRTPSPA
ncbi:hypothetical protein [Streptomyces sp. KR55]|uniref:hypothetical protein n=1 Tax=Streptomyces sp. KR55 TaxID=3457425 RepID=UPI003FCFA1D0